MRITFDDELEPDASDTPTVTVDDIRDAERAVLFCRRHMAEAVADVQALDGLSGWVSWLTGNHERDVGQALAVVKDRKQKLALAEAHLERTKRTMADETQRSRATQEVEIERLMALELVADRLRHGHAPEAAELRRLEEAIADQRALAKDYEAVFATGMAIRGQLARALQHLTAANFGSTIDVYGGSTGGALKMMAMRKVKQSIDGLPERLSRFQQVCDIIGLDVRLGDGVDRVHSASRSTMTDAFFDGLLADLLTARRIADAREGLERMKMDVEHAIDPVIERRKSTAAEVERLEQAREALLAAQA